MNYDAIKNEHGLRHDPFKAIVAPRPIGWISSLDAQGNANLAPYSFFNAVSDNPHIVMFSSAGWKDSVANIETTGEFVCNLATFALREQMNQSSAPYASGVSEFGETGLTAVASSAVKVPRVGEVPVALECRHLQTLQLRDLEGTPADRWMVLGQVVSIYIDDAVIRDGVIDVTELRPLARLGYHDYSVVDHVFQMTRPRGGGGEASGAA
ncbi:flavin reductase (DIM6/NTAB) family NADH-FMN oxidoreductase RutF [Breoghania corrubedonensis]|uniref:Flavin reductase (DIM6/NTAB) family NADH-FMN oxidoreductase RutF n=1 Tax=Breoghania corrubedonensis TaxID=665038 RepID=A0A2T5VD03_9HYPH|nr:flavin reductase family protein [Breoghania corrubedonensis]PTW61633.1 flavin reductase (DIM6/NTAB) family NADH-FMN oxidoreductase RutF [Breoghania corrubedonensis]